MYKLVAIGGRLRGTEFELQEGENQIGRDPSCTLPVSIEGVSKKHLRIIVNNTNVYLEDMGSSNGTFVNGKLIKKTNCESGDKIALPNVIFQLVYVKEKLVAAAKEGEQEQNLDSDDYIGPPPKTLPRKIVYLFRTKVMPLFHSFNEEYEWRIMFAIVLSVFVFVTVALTINPVIRTSRGLLREEIAQRGRLYADEIARTNRRALEEKNLDRLDTSFLENEDGIESYELSDLDGRIVRPLTKLNQYSSDTFSIKARNALLEREKKGQAQSIYQDDLDGGSIGIARAIKAYNAKVGIEEIVGIISIRFKPRSLSEEASNNLKSYFEAISSSIVLAVIFYAIVYFLMLRPMDELRIMIEKVLKGKEKELKTKYLMSELAPLRSTVNSLLQIVREHQNDGSSEVDEHEEDGPYVRTLLELAQGAGNPIMVLNSEKLIQKINTEAEDLVGIRESVGSGMGLLDVAKDQGFAATVIDLCDQSANNSGATQKGNYEIGGVDQGIFVTALIGKDSFAKAYYISFVREK